MNKIYKYNNSMEYFVPDTTSINTGIPVLNIGEQHDIVIYDNANLFPDEIQLECDTEIKYISNDKNVIFSVADDVENIKIYDNDVIEYIDIIYDNTKKEPFNIKSFSNKNYANENILYKKSFLITKSNINISALCVDEDIILFPSGIANTHQLYALGGIFKDNDIIQAFFYIEFLGKLIIVDGNNLNANCILSHEISNYNKKSFLQEIRSGSIKIEVFIDNLSTIYQSYDLIHKQNKIEIVFRRNNNDIQE